MINEYLEKFRALMALDAGPNGIMGLNIDVYTARHSMVLDYSWAIPAEGALDALAELGPIVEVGAGGGYWAALLRARGVDILAYDESPVGNRPNVQARRQWSEVRQAPAAVARRHADRALFLCWPPYAMPMAFSALYGYLDRGGKTLAFVGESDGGCTGNADFFDLIDEHMVEAKTCSLPQWPGIHDYLTIYTRKE